MKISECPMVKRQMDLIDGLNDLREKARQRGQFRHMRDLDKQIAREQEALKEACTNLRKAGYKD